MASERKSWLDLYEGAALRCAALRCVYEGAALNPFGAFLLLQGLETLPLRAERHNSNAQALAAWLDKHPRVAWVSHLGLKSHSSHELAKRYFRPGYFGSVLRHQGGRL
jgi:O-acetylhomoserine/O-acetylserine sulfhydrylase